MTEVSHIKDNTEPVQVLTPFSGMIAFFDIFGYKQIAQSGIAKNIEEVLRILQAAKDSIKAEIKTTDLKSYCAIQGFEQIVQSVLDSIETENISDSLVSTINFETCKRFAFRDEHKQPTDSTWFLPYVFLLYCTRLNSLLFRAGLPVRGAIEFGEIFKQERILAGKPLVNAYSLSENLNCAAVVLTVATETWLKSLVCFCPPLIWQNFNLLHVPTKKGSFDLQCLRNQGLFSKKTPITDVRDYVGAAFSRHSKDVSVDVLEKLANTIGLFTSEVALETKKRNAPIVLGLQPRPTS